MKIQNKDKLTFVSADSKYNGIMDETARFLVAEQLCDAGIKLYVYDKKTKGIYY